VTPDLAICTLFWDANDGSYSFSSMYDESWVEKLYRGFKRNCTLPFEFICWSEKDRTYSEPITQMRITSPKPGYADCIEPYRLNRPMILVGLDTVVTGNIDHLARYCLESPKLAVPRDPFFPETVCNGVALVPEGQDWVWKNHKGENDMDWIRSLSRKDVIDNIFPGHVVSYKGHVMFEGVGDARIVYFHGEQKPHQLDEPWIREHWV
jgi:hypothetical protein